MQKSLFGSFGPFRRLDAEYVIPSLLQPELQLMNHGGYALGSIANEYDGPTINDSFASESDLISYVSIDSIDNEDGLTYCDDLRFVDRPTRAKYLLDAGDILISNVRPNRGAVCLIGLRNSGS